MNKKTVNLNTLRNKVNREECRKKLLEESFARVTVSFYRYIALESPKVLRDSLWEEWSALGVFGRVYLAKEGVNAQISIPEHYIEEFRANLESREVFKNMPFKIAVEDDGKSFAWLKIKVREKIVADGLDDESFDSSDVGTHLSAEEWNEQLSNKDTVCIDMRNKYESLIGHFENAICPESNTFREELPEVLDILSEKNIKKENPVLLYCTGGIRCEKASAFLRHNGYKNVSQLHGGIIDYVRQAKEKKLPLKFRGKNYVFDDRVAEKIGDEVLGKCVQCGVACDEYHNCQNQVCNILFLQCADCVKKHNECCSMECQEIAKLPVALQKEFRRGKKNTKRVLV